MSNSGNQGGVTVNFREMYDMLLKLQSLPDLLARVEEQLERGLASTDSLISDVRDELRREVRERDAKFARFDSRISALELDKTAREGAERASDQHHAKKTPWTAIVAIVISSFTALVALVKDLIN